MCVRVCVHVRVCVCVDQHHITDCLIVANNLRQEGAGFGTDTNIVTLLSKEDTIELPIMSKEDVADELLSYIMDKRLAAT